MRFSWKFLLKLLMSSLVPLNINLALVLQFLAGGVTSVAHLIKFALSIRSLLSVQESHFACWLGVLDTIVLASKEMVRNPLINLMYGIHTDFRELPKLFFDKASRLIMVLATISRQR